MGARWRGAGWCGRWCAPSLVVRARLGRLSQRSLTPARPVTKNSHKPNTQLIIQFKVQLNQDTKVSELNLLYSVHKIITHFLSVIYLQKYRQFYIEMNIRFTEHIYLFYLGSSQLDMRKLNHLVNIQVKFDLLPYLIRSSGLIYSSAAQLLCF